MKLVLEIKNEPQKNDILLYNGSGWESISKDLFMKAYNKRLGELSNENAQLKEEINSLKEQINQKLKEHHDVLQQLVKGE